MTRNTAVLAGATGLVGRYLQQVLEEDAFYDDRIALQRSDYADFEPAIRALLPAAGAVSRAAVAFYSNSPDGHFIIDRLPGQPNILLAAGFSGHGFKFAPVVGEVLADLAQHGSTPHDIALFSLARLPGGTGGP